jgi:hypothetical protein
MLATSMKNAAAETGEKNRVTCECGSPLPVHFLELADERFSHICQCERKYKVEGGAFVRDGFEVNPFARFDDALAKAKKTKKARAKKTKKVETATRKEG